MNDDRYNRIDFHVSIIEEANDWQVYARAENVEEAHGPLGLPALRSAMSILGAPEMLTARVAQVEAARGELELTGAQSGWIEARWALFDALFAGPELLDLFLTWFRSLNLPPGMDTIARLVLHIEVPELALLPWETMYSPNAVPMPQVVRAITPAAQIAAQPLQMPMHVRQWDIAWPDNPLPTGLNVPTLVEDVFRRQSTGLPHAEMGRVVNLGRREAVGAYDFFTSGSRRFRTKQTVEQADILHITGVRSEPNLERLALLAPLGGSVRVPGFVNASMLLDFLISASVRLLVLQVTPGDSASQQGCLLLAHALVARGGPSVLVFSPLEPFPNDVAYFARFYDCIIHDTPLDVACRRAAEAAFVPAPAIVPEIALVVGARGEELVRFSPILGRTLRRRDEAQARLDQFMRSFELLSATQLESMTDVIPTWQTLVQLREQMTNSAQILNFLAGNWPIDWDHESSSSIPITANAGQIDELLAQIKTYESALDEHVRSLDNQSPTPRSQLERSARYVNTWLTEWAQGQLLPSDQPLRLQTYYTLHVNIGPYATESTVINPIAIPSAALQPIVESGGDWLHIAVYSPDFSLSPQPETSLYHMTETSAMQRFWLPATLASKPINFLVWPQRTGLAYLRICIYHRNQLLQSLRLDARVVGAQALDSLQEVPGIDELLSAKLRAAHITDLERFIAAATNEIMQAAEISPEQAERWQRDARRLRDLVGYKTFIEYTTNADLRSVDHEQPRAATIFTNATGGTHFVGVKVGDWDEVWGKENDWTDALAVSESVLADALSDARKHLNALGTVKNQSSGGEEYRFVYQNEGSDEDFKTLLAQLAYQGRNIYSMVFTQAMRVELAKVLQPAGQTIHIARVMEGDVLPWSIIYDLNLDLSLTDRGGSYTTCMKIFEHKGADGEFDFAQCSAQTDCPLKTAAANQTVCPWGFWGIKHKLEQPAQRVKEKETPRTLINEIVAGNEVNLCMNVSTQLTRLANHRQEIGKLPWIRTPMIVAGDDSMPGVATGRDQVLTELKNQGLQVIYFYCHGGTRAGKSMPYLAVGKDDSQMIVPDNLNDIDALLTPPRSLYEWPLHPLVFINGCETASLNPRTMGHFVQVFVEHGAAGVIGTEVPVWERFAAAFAEEFFARFLDVAQGEKGSSVGEIMYKLRHHFLKKKNPLGLVYTNYCSADLRFVRQ
jgi:hypothetical protein